MDVYGYGDLNGCMGVCWYARQRQHPQSHKGFYTVADENGV